MRISQRILAATAVLAGILSMVFVTETATAASYSITDPVDQVLTNGQCSLREAINAVNTQLAVDTCPAGTGADVITLPSGVFSILSSLSVTRPVTILGANAGIDGRASTRGAESIIRYSASTSSSPMFSLTGAGGASTFDGIDFQGTLAAANVPADGITAANSVVAITFSDNSGTPPSFSVTNSIFSDFTYTMYVSGTGQTVTNNDFRGPLVSSDPTVQAQLDQSGAYGNAIYTDFFSNEFMLNDNRFQGYSNGALILTGTGADTHQNTQILRNTVLTSGLGFLVSVVTGVRIEDNYISASAVNPSVRGIILSGGVSQAKILRNTITDNLYSAGTLNGAGIRVRDDYGTLPNSTVTVSGNRIYGNLNAFYVSADSMSDTIIAQGNWWGANAGIGGAGALGVVNGFDPAGVSSSVDASTPLQLQVTCPASAYVGTPVAFNATVPGMPTVLLDPAYYEPGWPRTGDVAAPVFAASATGAAVSAFTGIVPGGATPVIGGTVTGMLTAAAVGTVTLSVSVDSEQISCTYPVTEASIPTNTPGASASRLPDTGQPLALTLGAATLALVAVTMGLALRRRLAR